MGDFDLDTRVERVDGDPGRYRGVLSPDWAVWGPMGGYVAALALRAIAGASPLRRFATFACQFLAVGRFEPVEIEVHPLASGKRAHAHRAVVLQAGKPLLAASAWTVADELAGFEHVAAERPAVSGPDGVRGFQDLAENYADWYPFWRNVEGRPLVWGTEPLAHPPQWHAWVRVLTALPKDDLVLDAARSVLWLDLMMWNAACMPHVWPRRFIAPNLDLTVQFHGAASESEWLLCDSRAPIAREGLIGCQGAVWTPDGRLVASGSSQLFCRPNPTYAEELERHRTFEEERRRALALSG
jgi:acyl-CoA thioesterase